MTENASTVNPDIDKHTRAIDHAVRFFGTKSIVVLLVAIAGVLLAMVGETILSIRRYERILEATRRKVQVQGVSQTETDVIPNHLNSER